jgi:histidine triad (HIT) family protein
VAHDPDCIFCKIVAGELPCFEIYRDDDTLAFMDINPASTGHALVIPKQHWQDLHATPDQQLATTIATAKRVAGALQAELSPDGINLAQANGKGAAQSVMHFHMHIVPRRLGDELKLNWGMNPGDMDAIGELAKRIAARIAAA